MAVQTPRDTRRWFSFLNEINTESLPTKAQYGYIPGLDGIRAISVLIVVAAHLGFAHILPGGFGVTVFFFISGFLITRLLIAEQEKKGKIDLPNFYARRFIRLYPALLFMVFGTMIFYALRGYGSPTVAESLAAIFYFTNFYQINAFNTGYSPLMSWTQLWSLAVEEHFYMLFPLLVMFAGLAWRKLHIWVLAILIAVPIWRMVIFQTYDGSVSHYNYMSTFARIDSIAWGCLFTIMLHRSGLKILRPAIGVLPFLFAMGLLLVSFLLRDEMFRWVFRFSLQGFAIFVVMLNLYYLSCLRWGFKVLEFPPLAWIGMTSYALYLWHYPILDVVNLNLGPSALSNFITLLLSLIMTAISFYLVEKPFIKLRKRFGSFIPSRPKDAV